MRKLLAWLGAATLIVMLSVANAQAGGSTALKPYVVLILDTSGSMASATGSGPPSCGGTDTKLNHARCAINNIVNSYGDMVFAFGRFRETASGTVSGTCPSGCSLAQPSCATNGTSDDRFELMTSLVDGNNAEAASWTDFTCNTCTPSIPITSGQDPEVWNASGSTPLEGSLKGSKRYYQGLQSTDATSTVLWPANQPGFDPINHDPTNNVFLAQAGHCSVTTSKSCYSAASCPSGESCVGGTGTTTCNPTTSCDASAGCTGANCCCASQCRPYIVVMLTDGDETCGGTAGVGGTVWNAAASLLSTTPRNDAVSISTISRAANVVTVTTASANPLAVGDTVVIAGVTNTSFNGTFIVASVASTTQFTYAQTAANASSSGGTAGHVASLNKYRIETKPIGFGVTPGYANIEDMAHAGGALDVAGNEGYYANDEAGLELAISSIIAKSLRSEQCNNLDDDCDTLIDEDFPTKGQACTNGQLGACARTGTLACRADGTGVQCTAPTVTPGTEICNQIDDDCDGLVDEGLTGCACTPVAETCNGLDDNCNGVADDGIAPKQCAITNMYGSCPGTQLCTAGSYGACTGQTPTAEICDGLDNNCDGVADGFSTGCSNLVTPGGPATDNPGDPSRNPIPQNICHPGQKTCPVAPPGNGTFGACTGEVTPRASDPCNGLDDDCDNLIDEDFVPADCSTNCGIGQTACVNGQIMCTSTPASTDNTCNNIDDDCDGLIDEDWACDPSPTCTGANCCTCGTGTTCEINKCVNGQVTCTTTQAINPEQCNCLDDDCDGSTDEGTLCPGGATCTNCQCAFPCSPGEFPCPLGKKCSTNNFCVNDPCSGVTCPDVNGHAQTCVDQMNNGVCVDACSVVTCQSPLACYPPTGECRPDDCTTYPDRCAATENCVVDQNTGLGQCIGNPCSGVTCPSDKYCAGGECIASCADVTCPAGQRCRLGACEADPCGHACPFGQACNDSTGQCIADPCKDRQCSQGQWCNPNDGMCEPDPCVGTTCPSADQVCKGGTCYNPDQFQPDAGVNQHVTVGGGGCDTGGGNAGLLAGLGLLLVRRRRRGGAL